MKTTQEKTQAVREKIHELVPEILELKPGCHIVQKYSRYPWNTVVSPVYESGGESHIHTVDPTGQIHSEVYLERYKPSDNFIREILGRPITLADCIYALNIGEFDTVEMLEIEKERLHTLVVMWDWGKTFENQSEGFFDSLHSLLYPGEGGK